MAGCPTPASLVSSPAEIRQQQVDSLAKVAAVNPGLVASALAESDSVIAADRANNSSDYAEYDVVISHPTISSILGSSTAAGLNSIIPGGLGTLPYLLGAGAIILLVVVVSKR